MIKLFKSYLDVSLFGLAAALIISLMARWNYWAEMASHFMLQYAIIAIVLYVALRLLHAARWERLLAGFLILISGLHIAVLMFPHPMMRSNAFEDITILQFNINYSNSHTHQLSGWINNYTVIDKNIKRLTHDSQPDIVVLQEVSPEIAAKLTSLEQAYPYHIIMPKDGAFGMAIFSRIPIRDYARLHFPDSWNEYTEVQLHTLAQGIPITLTELHTVPPMSKRNAEQRHTELRYIANVIEHQQTMHKILIGDLNITPYSPQFRHLESEANLTNIMRGKSISGTWPSFFPIPLRIPIDHMLVSGNIEVLGRSVGRDMGSDHLPVLTTLRLYKSE